MDLREFQAQMRALYGERDRGRGLEATFAWFVEEVGELSRALRRGTHADRVVEFADVLAWLVSLAEVAGIDVERAALDRYGRGCPKCGAIPCTCAAR